MSMSKEGHAVWDSQMQNKSSHMHQVVEPMNDGRKLDPMYVPRGDTRSETVAVQVQIYDVTVCMKVDTGATHSIMSLE